MENNSLTDSSVVNRFLNTDPLQFTTTAVNGVVFTILKHMVVGDVIIMEYSMRVMEYLS